ITIILAILSSTMFVINDLFILLFIICIANVCALISIMTYKNIIFSKRIKFIKEKTLNSQKKMT
ncbi:hypothetical protein Q6293_28570, partial [Klebsiella pneumoniae]|uniref:hypothetical protein n=1 Tax=Klebsiella pneumoniae TaxID=573 RepID=UPI00272F393A